MRVITKARAEALLRASATLTVAAVATLAFISSTQAQVPEGSLTQIDCIFDPIGGVTIAGCDEAYGLDSAYSVTTSPDGGYAYAAAYIGDTLTTYAVETGGTLRQIIDGCRAGGDRHRCGASDGLDGAVSVTTSPDGAFAYVAAYYSDTLTAYRVETDGSLTQIAESCRAGTDEHACGASDGLDGAVSVTTSPDGGYVYTAAYVSNTLTAYKVGEDGSLTQIEDGCEDKDGGECGAEDGLDGASSVTVSPDGRYVYVAADYSDTLTAYKVGEDGSLTQIEGGCKDKDGGECGAEDGLDGARSVTTSPDGGYVYAAAAASDTLTAYKVGEDRSLTQIAESCRAGTDEHACGTSDGLDGAVSVTTSPDGGYVYAAAYVNNVLTAYKVTQTAKDGTGSGQEKTSGQTTETTPDPTPEQPSDTIAPTIDSFKATRKRLHRPFLRKRKRKTVTVKLNLSEDAKVKVRVLSKKKRKYCKKKDKGKKTCRRSRLIAKRSFEGKSGDNRLRLKVKSRYLKRGLYRLDATATDEAGNRSKKVKARFRVVR